MKIFVEFLKILVISRIIFKFIPISKINRIAKNNIISEKYFQQGIW